MQAVAVERSVAADVEYTRLLRRVDKRAGEVRSGNHPLCWVGAAMMTPDELAQLMFRCDRAIGKLREERLSRRNANELIGATMSLMNRIRVEQNSVR